MIRTAVTPPAALTGGGGLTRGGSVKRTRDVRVRLTPEEHALWDAARAQSGRKELGAWVRAAVNEMLTGNREPRRPGDLARTIVPPVNVDAWRQLVGIATNVNQLAHWCNSEQRAGDAATLRRLAAEVEAAAWAVRGVERPAGNAGLPPAQPGPPPVEHVQDESLTRAAEALAQVRGRAGNWWRRPGSRA